MQMYKGGQMKKICETKSKENEVQTDRNEILRTLVHRTAQFYIPRPTPLTNEYQPRHEKSHLL